LQKAKTESLEKGTAHWVVLIDRRAAEAKQS
jgi:hypothetical protein